MNKQGSTVCECGRDDVHSTRDCWTLENKMKKYTDLNIWIHKLKQIMDEKMVLIWLSTPNNAFENRIPMNMIMEGKTEELNRMIYELGEGAFL
jgi:hypothetical protein